jgi:hypothetical protein
LTKTIDPNQEVDSGKNYINNHKKEEDHEEKFPPWHQQHSMEPADLFKKPDTGFFDIGPAVLVNKPASIIGSIDAKARVDFSGGLRIDFTK